MMTFNPDRSALVERRRHFRTHPELAFQEVETSRHIAEFLESVGWTVHRGVGGTGVVAQLTREPVGASVMIRVDIDALPLDDELQAEFRSSRQGAAHACGHDGHIAVALTVAEWLTSQRDWHGRVTLVFQPAEEILQGAQAMIKDGLFEFGPFDSMLAFHLWNFLPLGKVGVRAGPSHASVERVDIEVHGTGGHGGMPHLAVDAGFVLNETLSTLDRLISRIASPLDAVTLTFGEVKSGSTYNVLPDKAVASGTLRTLSPDVHHRVREAILRTADLTARIFRASASCTFSGEVPPVVSDSRISEIVREVAAWVVGEEEVVAQDPVMGGDDASLLLQSVPGAYFVVGSQRVAGERHPTHHHPAFNFEEDALVLASRVLALSARQLLSL